jgi:ubiquinone/menaquinone biosynthesis C-methylase UbiE
VKLVIGTRHWLGPEWTHLDADPTPLLGPDGTQHPVDLLADANRIPLPNDFCDHVYSQECLEHFPWADVAGVLAEWCRVVKRGGTMRVEVPDFLAACKQVLETDSEKMDFAIQQIIFGGQANRWDFHYVGLTPRMLTRMFESNRFTVYEIGRGWDVGWLRVDARRR